MDICSGVGGASLGFKLSGFQVLGAVDIDPVMCKTYADNLSLVPICGDIRELSYRDILGHFDLSQEDVTVLVGCPPCQNFSSLRRTRPWREGVSKDELLVSFCRLVREGLPKVVVFENVHGIVTLEGGRYLNFYLEELRKLGYGTVLDEVNAADYGVPQFRKRVVAFSVMGAKSNELIMPEATHTNPVKASESGKLPWTTVRDAISDLPPLETGGEYPSIPNHRARQHGQKMLRVIKSIPKDGGSRKDLPKRLWLPCHLRLNDGGADSVYGRMWWEKPSGTITTRCTTASSGRFVHPDQDRAITPREAARLQTFPDWFTFPRVFGHAERAIGNAVPPSLVHVLVEGFLNENRGLF